MKNDIAFRISHIFKISRSSPVRAVLTAVGVFAAVFLLAVGMIVTESIYNTRFEIINASDGKTLIASAGSNADMLSGYAESVLGGDVVNVLSLPVAKPICSKPIGEGRYLVVNTRFHGIDSASRILPAEKDGWFYGIEAELCEGRLLSDIDFSRSGAAVVIDKFTAELLFGNESAIGKSIEITNNYGAASVIAVEEDVRQEPLEMRVIGVIKNNILSENRRRILEGMLDSDEANVFLTVDVYCPIGFLSENFADLQERVLFTFEEEAAFERFLGAAFQVAGAAERRGEHFGYTAKDIQTEELSTELSQVRSLLDIIVAVICVISGISIMSIIFFSIKERIPEIGIRKAFGATKSDIVFQFVLESVTVAFAASAAASVTAFYAATASESFLSSYLMNSLRISMAPQKLMIPILAGILEAVACSIVPALYAANIKVTDALRFE